MREDDFPVSDGDFDDSDADAAAAHPKRSFFSCCVSNLNEWRLFVDHSICIQSTKGVFSS